MGRKLAVLLLGCFFASTLTVVAHADPIEKCVPVPAKTSSQSILGVEVPGVGGIELCVKADVQATGEPQLRNYEGCGSPCFAIVVRNLKVTADVTLVAKYSLNKKPQDPIVLATGQQVIDPLGSTHQCIYSYYEDFNPCHDGISTPANVKATGAKARIALSWSRSFAFGEAKVAGYEVLRSATGAEGTFAPIATTTELSFVDQAVTKNQTFWYSIVALANDGSRSGASTAVSATAK